MGLRNENPYADCLKQSVCAFKSDDRATFHARTKKENIHFSYNVDLRADITLKIPHGQLVAVVGPVGSGKLLLLCCDVQYSVILTLSLVVYSFKKLTLISPLLTITDPGKSSLISALLGNMYKTRGYVALAGTVAYCRLVIFLLLLTNMRVTQEGFVAVGSITWCFVCSFMRMLFFVFLLLVYIF